jgi:hypothetical protein
MKLAAMGRAKCEKRDMTTSMLGLGQTLSREERQTRMALRAGGGDGREGSFVLCKGGVLANGVRDKRPFAISRRLTVHDTV